MKELNIVTHNERRPHDQLLGRGVAQSAVTVYGRIERIGSSKFCKPLGTP